MSEATDISINPNINKQYSTQQEVNDLWEILKVEKNKYLKYSIILEAIEEAVQEDNDLDDGLKRKVKDILLSSQCCQAAVIDTKLKDQRASTIFGIGETSEELSFLERNVLKDVLEQKLNGLLSSFDINESSINTRTKSSTFQLLEHDQANLDLQLKLKNEEKVYFENLVKRANLLEDLKNLRLKKVPQITDNKYKECEAQCKLNHLKSEILHRKIRVDTFSETNTSIKAYKELISDLKLQFRDCQREINNLNDLKDKYKVVSCRQYEDILKSYLQYKASNEKKKMLYECLKS